MTEPVIKLDGLTKVFLTDEVVEKRCGYLESRCVNPPDDLHKEFADAVNIQTVKVNALPLGQASQLLFAEGSSGLRAVNGHQARTHPQDIGLNRIRPVEGPIWIVIFVDRSLG